MSNGDWYASNNPEIYSVGPCSTREDAIEEFKEENEGKMPSFLGKAEEVFATVDGCSLVENIGEYLHDNLYEGAVDGWCHFKRNDPRWDTLSERLTKVLHEWLDEVGEQKSFDVIHTEERL